MNTLRNTLLFSFAFLLAQAGVASTLPTLHAVNQHHYAMLLVPPSDHPVTIKITDGQQRVFLHLVLDATTGVEKNIDFSWMPAGHYHLEVHYEGQALYKTMYVRPDRVGSLDATVTFRTTSDTRL